MVPISLRSIPWPNGASVPLMELYQLLEAMQFLVSFKYKLIMIFVMNFAKCDYNLYFLADIKLESETEETTDFSDITLPPNVYHPKHALITALKVITVIFSIKYILHTTFEFSL